MPTVVSCDSGAFPSVQLVVLHETFPSLQPLASNVDHLLLALPLPRLSNQNVAGSETVQRLVVVIRGGADHLGVLLGAVLGHGGEVGEGELAGVALVRQLAADLLVPPHVVHQVLLEHEGFCAALVRANPRPHALVELHVAVQRLPVGALEMLKAQKGV